MESNELMIGDWVRVKRTQKIVKVKEVKQSCIYTEDNGYEYNEIEPIPLVPEIVEKNGFKPYVPENHLETVYSYQDVSKAVADELYALWPYRDGSFYLLLRIDGKDMVRMDVHYIHQLQHAFRLCGIEKEIEL